MCVARASILPVLVAMVMSIGSFESARAQQKDNAMEGMSSHVRAPSIVMGLHSLSSGELMMTYRFGMMKMGEGHQHLGSTHVTLGSVLDDFSVAPLRMTSSSHMINAMVGLPGRIAGTLMLPVVHRSMDHRTATGDQFSTQSRGIGDMGLGLVGNRQLGKRATAGLGLSLSFPTGTTSARDVTPTSSPRDMHLPYPMQIGSGSVEIRPEATVSMQWAGLNVGGQLRGTFRTGENDAGYRLGDAVASSAWVAFGLGSSTDASVRLTYNRWGNISGSDPRLHSQLGVVPTADPTLRQGSELWIAPELSIFGGVAPLGSHSLALGVEVPLWHSLTGPQLGLAWAFRVSWTISTNWGR
jgi:hypothetical protein